MKYGWAGNQAALFADAKSLIDRKAYDEFLSKLDKLPVPEFLKTMKDNVVSKDTDLKVEEAELDIQDGEVLSEDGKVIKHKRSNIFKAAQRHWQMELTL